jgi:hypothetical protein
MKIGFTAAIMSSDCTIGEAKARRGLGYRPLASVDEALAQLAPSR